MVLINTLCIIARTASTYYLLFPNPTQSINVNLVRFFHYGDACMLVFANWGADLLMVSTDVISYH